MHPMSAITYVLLRNDLCKDDARHVVHEDQRSFQLSIYEFGIEPMCMGALGYNSKYAISGGKYQCPDVRT